MNGHAQRSWVNGFQSLLASLLPLLVSILTPGRRERQKERKRPVLELGGGGAGGVTYREDEGTVLYELHLLQNAVSSLSSIPHLISPNNLPFSSCPNRESQTLRVCKRERESEKSLLHLLSLTLTLSFSVCWLVIE